MTSKKIILLPLLFFLSGFFPSSAQFYNQKKYTAKEGISSSFITNIFQDSKGYLWIGSRAGLSRFDGLTFKNYSIRAGLSNHNVYCITESPDGSIWVGTLNGLNRILNDKIQVYTEKDGLPSNKVRALCADKNTLWIGTEKGLSRFMGNVFKSFGESRPILSISGDDQKNILAGTSAGLFYCSGSFRYLWDTSKIKVPVYSSLLDKDGDLWLAASHHGLYKLKRSAEIPESVNEYPSSFAGALLRSKSSEIYIRADYGMYIYENDKYTFSFCEDSTLTVFDFIQDTEGNFWIGQENGLFRRSHGFIKVLNCNDGFCSRSAATLLKDRSGRIWMAGIDNKISIINGKNIKDTLENKLFEHGNFSFLMQDQNDDFWASGSVGNLVRFNSNGTTYFRNRTEGGDRVMMSMLQDRKGNYWFGAENGLQKFDGKNFQLIPGVGTVRTITEKDGKLLFGTSRGLYTLENNIPNLFPDSQVIGISITEVQTDKNGDLWVASGGRGLLHFPAGKYYSDYSWSVADGLSSDYVLSFDIDENGVIWVATFSGLSSIHPDKNGKAVIRNYTPEDALPDALWNDIQMLLDDKGQIWCASSGGAVLIDVNNPSVNKRESYIHLNRIELTPNSNSISSFSEGTDPNGLPLNTELPYNINTISFYFTGISLTGPSKVRYSYFLKGLDKKWSEPLANNNINYNNLPPGDYEFMLKASNNDGVWNKNPLIYKFSIAPPFWRSWWFITALIILIPTIIILLFRRRVAIIRSEERTKTSINNQIAQLKMSALRAQMNPHFIFNALNSIQECIVNQDTDAAYSYLSKFSRLLRIILQSSEKAYVSLAREIEMLKLYLEIESLRFDQTFEYAFNIDPDLVPAEYNIPTLLIQPYVENALWHGLIHKSGKRKLIITIKLLDENIEITVYDNGIGRRKAKEIKDKKDLTYESKGMNLSKDRLKLINFGKEKINDPEFTDLHDENGNASGTLVKILVPVNLNVEQYD